MATSSATRDFPGSVDFLDTGDDTTYDFTSGNITVAAWVLVDSADARSFVVGNHQTSSPFNGWGWQNSGASGSLGYQRMTRDATIAATGTATTEPDVGSWNGIAAQWAISVPDCDFYQLIPQSNTINTENVASSGNPTASSNTLRIGQGTSATGDDFNGKMSHLQIFEGGSLNPNRINNALWSPGSNVKNLVGYWPMYGQLDPEPDLSLTGADATVNGGVTNSNAACPAIPQQMPIT